MYMINYTSDDFKKNLEKTNVVIIPVGSVEAHGHHLPLGTDMFSPKLLCERLEEKISDDIWIAPGLPYGQCNDLSIYPGTVTVTSEALANYAYEVGKGMYKAGLRKLIFLNGHGGNVTALRLASEKLSQLGLDVVIMNWWLDYSKEILTVCEGQGHAGEDETSAVLCYDEHLVQMDKATKNENIPLFRVYSKDLSKILYKNALSGDATLASKEKGEKMFKIITDKMIDLIHNVKDGKYYTSK